MAVAVRRPFRFFGVVMEDEELVVVEVVEEEEGGGEVMVMEFSREEEGLDFLYSS